jgi:hypothetical protein
LQFAYTGPWKVVAILDGASYALEHAKFPNKKDTKHASDLSPYPAELIAFEPMDGPDTRYGQLYKPISSTALNEDGKKFMMRLVFTASPPSVHIEHTISVVRLIYLFLRGAFVGLHYQT